MIQENMKRKYKVCIGCLHMAKQFSEGTNNKYIIYKICTNIPKCYDMYNQPERSKRENLNE